MTVLDRTKLHAQVERLAASAEFARSDRMVQFLRYVVAKTLEGDTAALRERAIGIAVFERASDWDPKLDNIVRSEARRLRSKLEAYAAGSDPDETVRITMPTGGYAVHFEERYAERERAVEAPAAEPAGVKRKIQPKPGVVWNHRHRLPAVNCVLLIALSIWVSCSRGRVRDRAVFLRGGAAV